MVADLEALIPSAALAVGFVLLIRAILRNQNPQRRAASRAREAAAEAADPRIMQDQRMPSDVKPPAKPRPAKKTAGGAGKPAASAKTAAATAGASAGVKKKAATKAESESAG